MNISPLAGHAAPAAMLLDVSKLVTAYYSEIPDPGVLAERVAFGTSGHRGSAFERTFNEWHVVAISEAICRYRRHRGIEGPRFLGLDTHAVSVPAGATARAARDPGELYGELTREFGEPAYDRLEAPATAEQKRRLAGLAAGDVRCETLAGERVLSIISKAPGNGAPIGGVKISSATGWFAARPSGTEEIYKIYAESFRGRAALDRILVEAQAIVDAAL